MDSTLLAMALEQSVSVYDGQELPNNLKDLVRNKLLKRDTFSAKSLARLLHPRVETIHINDVHLTAQHLEALQALESLKRLTLSNIENKDDDLKSALYRLVSNSVHLTTLDLCNNPALIDDALVMAIGQNCQRLTSLQLAKCPSITSCPFLRLKDAFPNLKSLDLSHSSIDDDGLIALSNMVGLKESLEELNVSKCQLITDEGLLELHSFPHLKYLWFNGCSKVSPGFINMFSATSGLRQVSFTISK